MLLGLREQVTTVKTNRSLNNDTIRCISFEVVRHLCTGHSEKSAINVIIVTPTESQGTYTADTKTPIRRAPKVSLKCNVGIIDSSIGPEMEVEYTEKYLLPNYRDSE